MPRVILRPTIPSDIPHLIDGQNYRIRAITAVLAGTAAVPAASLAPEERAGGTPAVQEKILGIGGIAFPPNEPPWAFVQQAPEAKNYPVAFHRAGLMAMAMIRASGIREVVATCDADNPAAIRWLRRLGFVEGPVQKLAGKIVWFWSR